MTIENPLQQTTPSETITNPEIEQKNNTQEIIKDSTKNQPEFIQTESELVHTEEEFLAEYKTKNDNLSQTISVTELQRDTLLDQINKAREDLGLPTSNDAVENTPSVVGVKEQLKLLTEEKIKASSNYPGNWTNLLMERMLDPISKQKFIKTREASMRGMKDGEPGYLDRPETFSNYYQKQIDEYDKNIISVFNQTGISNARENNKKPHHLGIGNYGKSGIVFSDATNDGKNLDSKQKDIVDSHEKGHGLRDFYSSIDINEIRQVIDREIITRAEEKEKETNPDAKFSKYLTKPDEIIERMSQLKNYYGFSAKDVFTLDHLEYAKKNYVTDTGLDNQISILMNAITPETVEHFLKVMNEYPI